MRAIILAAGMGRRLAPMGWDQPKCLLPIGSTTLLDNIFRSLKQQNVRDVALVVGYQHELVQEAASKHDLQCHFVVNEDFANTNTIHSLWLAREFMTDEFFYFNADVWFDPNMLSLLMQSDSTALAIDQKSCGQEEVKVVVDDQLRITEISKQLEPAQCYGEFIGIAKFSRETAQSLIAALKPYNENPQQRNLFFETALNDILDQHIIQAAPMGNLRAVEIDTPQDYERAKKMASASTDAGSTS